MRATTRIVVVICRRKICLEARTGGGDFAIGYFTLAVGYPASIQALMPPGWRKTFL